MIIIINNRNGINPKDKKVRNVKPITTTTATKRAMTAMAITAWMIPRMPNRSHTNRMLATIRIYSYGCITMVA